MKRRFDHQGFTQVELIVAIAITGLLAAVAIPRFVGVDSFKSRGFYDEATGIVRYAQKTAIAWRQPVFVCISATEIRAISNNDCNSPVTVAHPTTGGTLMATAPSGVTVSAVPPGSFSFDGIGRPSAGKVITLNSTIADDPARQIVVEAETGYVRR